MTDNPTLDSQYFEWLYQKVAPLNVRNPAQSYIRLCQQMYRHEFEIFVPNDDNRAEDARELREQFLGYYGIPEEIKQWAMLPASVFEVLIALGERTAFEAEGAPSDWFWHILDNVGLLPFTDAAYRNGTAVRHVEEILNRVVRRTYSPSGRGGMFPLEHARRDQRKVELWYQMSAYLLEKTL